MSSSREQPQGNELSALPLRAIVAFACRCALRVQPLATRTGSYAIRRDIFRALEIAVRYAAGLVRDSIVLSCAADAADAARRRAKRAEMEGDLVGAAAADAAAAAADAAYAAADHDFADAAAAAVDGAESATDAAATVGIYSDSVGSDDAEAEAKDAVRHDFELLRDRLSKVRGRIHSMRFPQDIFGPLWPGGAPEWWPKEGANGLSFSIVLPEYHDQELVVMGIVELYAGLNDLHIAFGGSGLKLGGGEAYVVERAPSEVLQ